MSENNGEIRKLAHSLRAQKGPEVFNLNATGDRLGIFSHPDLAVANELRGFFPELLRSLMLLEQQTYRSLVEKGSNPGEFAGLQQLVDVMSKVLYIPEDPEDRQDFLKRTVRDYKTQSSILEYPQRGRNPRWLSGYDFATPALMKFDVEDVYSGQHLFIEFFPTRYAGYRGRNAHLVTNSPEQTREDLAQRVDPAQISQIIRDAEETAVQPHMAIRLEGRSGEPISTVVGNLTQKKLNTTQVYGFDLQPILPGVSTEEKVFLPIRGMRKIDNVPMGHLARSVLGLRIKTLPASQISKPRSR